MKNPDLAALSMETTVFGPWALVRLDGVNFSTLTRDPVFDRPFDLDFAEAMRRALLTLCSKVNAPVKFGYTQSDEITLLLHVPSDSSWCGGRAFKMTTVLASYAATSFTRHLASVGKLPDRPIAFDARILDIGDDLETILEVFEWRMADAAINTTTSWGRFHLGRAALHGVGTKEMREILCERNLAWEDHVPEIIRFGQFSVRESFMREMDDGIGTVERHAWTTKILTKTGVFERVTDIVSSSH